MPRDDHAEPCPFTAAERELIRRELGMHFGSFPDLADGILLRTWRSGPRQGQPKLPAAVQTMLDRDLVEIRRERLWARATFTEAGRTALLALVSSRRFLPPDLIEHLRHNLGVNETKRADASGTG